MKTTFRLIQSVSVCSAVKSVFGQSLTAISVAQNLLLLSIIYVPRRLLYTSLVHVYHLLWHVQSSKLTMTFLAVTSKSSRRMRNHNFLRDLSRKSITRTTTVWNGKRKKNDETKPVLLYNLNNGFCLSALVSLSHNLSIPCNKMSSQ